MKNKIRSYKSALALGVTILTMIAPMSGHAQDVLPKGTFFLTSKAAEAKGLQLESNGGPNEASFLEGAAFMSPKGKDGTYALGQAWKAIPSDEEGYFFLTTEDGEKKGLQLEGNGGPNEASALKGAAFMSPKQNVTGQLWKATPSGTEGYFFLTIKDAGAEGLQLESNGGPDEASVLKGAAFMSPKAKEGRRFKGQLWKAIPKS